MTTVVWGVACVVTILAAYNFAMFVWSALNAEHITIFIIVVFCLGRIWVLVRNAYNEEQDESRTQFKKRVLSASKYEAYVAEKWTQYGRNSSGFR